MSTRTARNKQGIQKIVRTNVPVIWEVVWSLINIVRIVFECRTLNRALVSVQARLADSLHHTMPVCSYQSCRMYLVDVGEFSSSK